MTGLYKAFFFMILKGGLVGKSEQNYPIFIKRLEYFEDWSNMISTFTPFYEVGYGLVV